MKKSRFSDEQIIGFLKQAGAAHRFLFISPPLGRTTRHDEWWTTLSSGS